jgi:predicted nuclease with TOPRIM domain
MNLQAELERLRLANSRLESAVQELNLEIAYYKGETKRLEWEKEVIDQDFKRLSHMFKNWVDEVHDQASQLSDQELVNKMVRYPCKSISELLQLNDNILFVTSCQPPHFIEVKKKKKKFCCI